MAKVFKGFKQVSAQSYNAALEANTADGYLWFVRTSILGEGETENDVANDEYDIYFGKKQYGHFRAGEIEGIKSSIESLAGDVETLVSTLETLTGVVEENKAGVASNKAAHEANAAAIKGVQDTLAKYLVKDVDANDKVLNVADGILTAQVGLEYTGGRIVLTGKDGVEITGFDASEFVKDSVLEDVMVETREDNEKYIVFTWKTEGEETKTDEIKVSDFAKLYNAGTALELAEDGVTFNVKVAENGNFLSVNNNNELIVDDITTDKTMLKEAITIEGGPLATDAVKGAFEGGVIPAGTDIQAVLKALLCVTIYPVPTPNTPTYTASISTPSITAKIGDTAISSGALVEVGQTISFAAVTAKGVSTTPTNPTVSGFTHGYSDTIDGTINTATTVTGSWSIEQGADTVYKLEPSKTNFTGDVPASASSATYSSCQVSACTLTAIQGTNTYSVTESAPEYVGTSTAIASKYIVSNLGTREEAKKSDAINAIEDKKVTATAKTGSFSVTGTYPMYTNGVKGSLTNEQKPNGSNLTTPVDGDGTKLDLMSAGSLVIKFASQGLAPYKLYIPQPLNWKISKALYTNPLTGKVEADGTQYFKANGTTTRTIQGVSVTYDVWEWAASQGADFVKFTVASK
jgi:hypothetical protein